MLYFLFPVVKATVLLADINDFGEVNNVYKQCKLSMRFDVLIAVSIKINTWDSSVGIVTRLQAG
jgi:hypothetical protein